MLVSTIYKDFKVYFQLYKTRSDINSYNFNTKSIEKNPNIIGVNRVSK